jgi:hypothetical protein
MTEELLKALELIKETCKKCDECEDCPLANSAGNCGVKQEVPEEWKLKKKEVYF